MAEIDPLVAEILLKGDTEFLDSLKKVGDNAEKSFGALSKAVADGATSFTALTGSLHLIEAAIAGVAAATIAFIDHQTELSQATLLLADAFGTTGEQLQNIEQVFASSGVKAEQFERFAVRLTSTIAREWPQIAESIKTYATENDAATLRVSSAILRVQDAQKALADNSEERASRMAKDNHAVEQSYITLQFAAQHAASEQLGALQAVRGAQLSVTAAEQHLAELEGRPPSAADKKNLEIAQARQAVDTARKAANDALVEQQEKAAEAALKRAKAEQDHDDLARKAAKNARDDAEQRQKDENSVKEAIIARAEAEEKAAKLALTNVGSIKGALKDIVEGNKGAASQINLTEVSVENLKKGFIALANESAKATPPTGFEALRTLAKLFENDVEHLINPQQRLRLVTELSGSAMQALGKSAAEILSVIENGSEKFEAIAKGVNNFKTSIDASKHAIEDYRGALNNFNLTMSQLSQLFAAAIAPAFTAFLKGLNELFIAVGKSATESGGYIHELWTGMKALGDAIGLVVSKGGELLDWFAKAASKDTVTAMDLFKAALIGIGVALIVATGPLGVWTVAIGLIVTAIGAIIDKGPQIALVFNKVWDQVKDNSVVKFFEGVLEVILRIVKGIGILTGYKGSSGSGDSAPSSSSSSASEGGSNTPPGHAAGGFITGPGTGTSDSIAARLSNGEFVTRAAAVQKYGVDFFHALNSMTLPGFASGGLVGVPARVASSAPVQASRPLNLTIEGRTFSGFRGPAHVVDSLANFAIARQTSTAGRAPSWVK